MAPTGCMIDLCGVKQNKKRNGLQADSIHDGATAIGSNYKKGTALLGRANRNIDRKVIIS
ncbi:hypothetical protein GCM10011498_12320 [Amylibacter cionae]|uniref:Uncharacterized protein n=1 Tax=Neptunicoccus cionae TaxID=2035344 RepID=A0A916QV50_9RHOB|nr:hypothetical protein GCM10011498_12320 [Amylibacter cionae]